MRKFVSELLNGCRIGCKDDVAIDLRVRKWLFPKGVSA